MLINYENEYDLSDPALQRILKHYVFLCPVEMVSQKAYHTSKTFPQMGWGGTILTSLIAALKRNTYSGKLAYVFIEDGRNVENEFKKLKKSNINDREIVVYKKSGNYLQTKSLFYAIRNAFAHGDFSIEKDENGDKLYTLRNFHAKEVKAYLCLYEKTLLMWLWLLDLPSENLSKANYPKGVSQESA